MHAARWKVGLIAGWMLAAPAAGSAADWRSAAPNELLTPLGEYVLLGGGVTSFADDATRDRFDAGGTWDLRLGVGSR